MEVNKKDEVGKTPAQVKSLFDQLVEVGETYVKSEAGIDGGSIGLVGELVVAAEGLYTGIKQGQLKHESVKSAFHLIDEKFHVVEQIDDKIELPVWLEPLDGPAIRLGIDLLIMVTVSGINRAVWKK